MLTLRWELPWYPGLQGESVLLRGLTKTLSALAAGQVMPQAKYSRCVFVLSHMRSVSTALTNVLCSHPSLSGYGETHVPHTHSDGAGRLVVNVIRYGAWQMGSPYVVDKILHEHLDRTACDQFYDARAVFLLRAPGPAIASIRQLNSEDGKALLPDADSAARYYLARLETLSIHWHRFDARRRIGVKSEDLLSSPDAEIERVGNWLALRTPLRNGYRSHPQSHRAGGGDPSVSARRARIVARKDTDPSHYEDISDVTPELALRCVRAHRALSSCIVS